MDPSRREFLAWSAAGVWAGIAGGASAAPRPRQEGGAAPGAGPKRLLILGGTAFLGPELVHAAKARGHAITLFNRGRTNPQLFPELEKLRGDRNGDLKALEGRKWDWVVDTSGYVPRQVRLSAGLLKDAVERYVFISTMSVYADTSRPDRDETDAVAELGDRSDEKVTNETYGALKALCEKEAEKAMPGRVANIRPGLIVGPGDPSDRFTYWPVRVARGGEVLSPGTPEDPVRFIDVRDLAEWTVRMLEGGHVGVYNATGPEKPVPISRLLDACKEESGSDASFTWVEADFLASHKVAPWRDMPVWLPPRGDTAGFARASVARAVEKGLTFRPVGVTVRDTLAWWNDQPEERRRRPKAGISPEREAEVLEAWRKRKEEG